MSSAPAENLPDTFDCSHRTTFPSLKALVGTNHPNGANGHTSDVSVRRVRSDLHTRRHSQRSRIAQTSLHSGLNEEMRYQLDTLQDHLRMIDDAGSHGMMRAVMDSARRSVIALSVGRECGN
jgi:hypothetical protein